MKLTTDGIPLSHLVKPVHMKAIQNYSCPYLLVNKHKIGSGSYAVTPTGKPGLINPEIIVNLSLPSTRAVILTKTYRNNDKGLLVGRADFCDIVITHPCISRRHARLYVHGEHVVYEDLNSTRGSFIGLEKINLRKVPSQQVISLGGIPITIMNGEDLQLLCSMLPEYWKHINAETSTGVYCAPLV